MKKAVFLMLCIFIWLSVPVTISARNWTADDVRELLGDPEKRLFEIIFVTDTGSKYHNWGCHYLHSCNPISVIKAIEKGYTPCSYCSPPEIPDSYYEFQDMNAEGDLQTIVFVYDEMCHRKGCPKLESNYDECTLQTVYENNLEHCKYCNPQKLNYSQIQELRGIINYSSKEPVDWLENPILVIILIISGGFLGCYLFFYFREIYRSIKNKK